MNDPTDCVACLATMEVLRHDDEPVEFVCDECGQEWEWEEPLNKIS